MSWLQISLLATPENAQSLCDLLTNAGAKTVSMQGDSQEAIYEPPADATALWSHTRVIGLFDQTTDIDKITSFLQTELQLPELPGYRIEQLEDKDWQNKWMGSTRPQCFGDRLWIYPSWHGSPPKDTINIILDPGLAFGTGTHPTTSLCLEWLDRHNVNGWKIIDYGCGSGILSIAAIKLGAEHVWAVDIDPQALAATLQNADRNNVSQCISPVLPTAMPGIKADCLIANILANPILELVPRFAELVRNEGRIILSGILSNQSDNVLAALRPFFDICAVVERADWVRIEAKHRKTT
jgi:ribosomal protein L11 methyltransferase